MVVFVLILLLLAALGILGAVIKVTLILVMSFVLAVVVVAVGGYYYLRHRFRRYVKETQGQQGIPPGQTGPEPQRGYPTTGTKGPGPSLPE